MALQEIFIYYDNDVIYSKRFLNKSGKQALDDKTRGDLIDAILAFAHAAFGDELSSFSTDLHQIQMHKHVLEFPSENFEGNDPNIFIFAISDLSSNKKAIAKTIKEILFTFVNKYTLFDIINKNTDCFSDFNDRAGNMCRDLVDTNEREHAKGERLAKAIREAEYNKPVDPYSFR